MPRKKTKKGTAARARTKKRRRVRIKTELIGLPQNRLWQIIHLEDSITWCNKLGLIALQIEIQNFRAWPYCSANRTFKFLSLALLRCKLIFEIFELGLIAVQTDFRNFRAWPYCHAPV